MVVTETAPPSSPAAPNGPGWLTVLRHPVLLRVFAWAAAITNGLIAVTGATVRVTGSGLGCATWPDCQPGSLIPVSRSGEAALHQAIEFSNRTLTGVVLVASLGTFVLALLARQRRRSIVLLSLAGPIGVLFQAVWGGVVVRTKLSWWTVSPHLLVSFVLLFFAIAVVVRLTEADGVVRAVVPRPLRLLTFGTVVVLTAVCIAGTLVTAAGPHGGDENTPRLDLPIRDLAQVHADLMFTFFGLIVAMSVGFLAVRAPRRLLLRTGILIVVTAAQGLIGLVQYATGVPEALVVSHVFGAVVLVATASVVVFATRTVEPTPARV